MQNLLRIGIGLMLFLVFVKVFPGMPGTSPDESWVLAMNQAVAQKLVFGRDIVFTYGPFGALLTQSYHPATYLPVLAGGMLMFAAYMLALLTLAGHRRLPGAVLVALGALLFTQIRDVGFLAYPLLVALVCYRLCLGTTEPLRLRPTPRLQAGVLLLFTPFALIPLVKLSFFLGVVAGYGAALLLLVYARHYGLALAAALTPPLLMPLFWCVMAQPLAALPHFLAGSLGDIVLGYASAMAYDSVPTAVHAYLLAAGSLLVALAWNTTGKPWPRLILLGSFAFCLFLVFKAALVRHDEHAFIGGGMLVILAGLGLLTAEGRLMGLATLICLVCSLKVANYDNTQTLTALLENARDNAFGTWASFQRYAGGSHTLPDDYRRQLQYIHTSRVIPALPGTTDIYSVGQSYLIASDNRWATRPVLQSYSAYTPALARLNADHLSGAAAPDNILFRPEPIDHHLPSLEDGASWPLLLRNYALTRVQGGYVYLRKTRPEAPPVVMASSAAVTARLNSRIQLPTTGTPLFASITLAPTPRGRLDALLWRADPLLIALIMADGQVRHFRFIPGMADCFLISPLVITPEDFAQLEQGDSVPASRTVKSFAIYHANGPTEDWQPTFTLRFGTLLPRADNVSPPKN